MCHTCGPPGQDTFQLAWNCQGGQSDNSTTSTGSNSPEPTSGCNNNNNNHHHNGCNKSNIPNIYWQELSHVKYLAKGAMCRCFTAEYNGQTVVVKLGRTDSRETPNEIERELELEAAMLHVLRHHPGIVRLYGRGVRRDRTFLVIEYLVNGTLEHYLESAQGAVKQRRLPGLVSRAPHLELLDVLEKAVELARVLRFMHDEANPDYAFIYRDLKPNNLGFDADGMLKLFDFGLAKAVNRSACNVYGRYRLTGRTGTIRYMAPEVFCIEKYNQKVDVYGWAHIVAEMLSLHRPYDNYDLRKYTEKVVGRQERPRLARSVPRTLRHLVKLCWAVDPDERPPFSIVVCQLEAMIEKERAEKEKRHVLGLSLGHTFNSVNNNHTSHSPPQLQQHDHDQHQAQDHYDRTDRLPTEYSDGDQQAAGHPHSGSGGGEGGHVSDAESHGPLSRAATFFGGLLNPHFLHIPHGHHHDQQHIPHGKEVQPLPQHQQQQDHGCEEPRSLRSKSASFIHNNGLSGGGGGAQVCGSSCDIAVRNGTDTHHHHHHHHQQRRHSDHRGHSRHSSKSSSGDGGGTSNNNHSHHSRGQRSHSSSCGATNSGSITIMTMATPEDDVISSPLTADEEARASGLSMISIGGGGGGHGLVHNIQYCDADVDHDDDNDGGDWDSDDDDDVIDNGDVRCRSVSNVETSVARAKRLMAMTGGDAIPMTSGLLTSAQSTGAPVIPHNQHRHALHGGGGGGGRRLPDDDHPCFQHDHQMMMINKALESNVTDTSTCHNDGNIKMVTSPTTTAECMEFQTSNNNNNNNNDNNNNDNTNTTTICISSNSGGSSNYHRAVGGGRCPLSVEVVEVDSSSERRRGKKGRGFMMMGTVDSGCSDGNCVDGGNGDSGGGGNFGGARYSTDSSSDNEMYDGTYDENSNFPVVIRGNFVPQGG